MLSTITFAMLASCGGGNTSSTVSSSLAPSSEALSPADSSMQPSSEPEASSTSEPELSSVPESSQHQSDSTPSEPSSAESSKEEFSSEESISEESSSEDYDGFRPSLDTDTSCEIVVAGSYANFEALEIEFNAFNEFYPMVNLVYQKIDDYTRTIGSVLEDEGAPNIFFSYASWMGEIEGYGSVLARMEDLSGPTLELDLDCIRPDLLQEDAVGEILMVPVFSKTYGMLVNENLFAKENIAIPTTWDELLNACMSFGEKGYKSPMMGYSVKNSNCLMNAIVYPEFVAKLAEDPEAIAMANSLDPAAGEYMREALTKMRELFVDGAIDISECDSITDNFAKVILRFFEGDVPMMICNSDTVSGTGKREALSEAYSRSPFEYSFAPIPMTDNGGYFLDSPSVEFAVNKDCENLDMTNEFMRFLVRNEELNAMSLSKRMVTPTKELSFDPIYAAFGQIPAERTFSPETLGVTDAVAKQISTASFKVGREELTVEEAISQFGSF